MSWFENQENYYDKHKGGIPERRQEQCKECKKYFISREVIKKCETHINNKNIIRM